MAKILRILDFDDTIFSREEQLVSEPLLRENRWSAGIDVIIHTFWITPYIQKYYTNKSYPKDLLQETENVHICILTLGDTSLQQAKIQALWLGNIPQIIVKNGPQEKIEALITYVQSQEESFESIEIYEDRPQYFIENRDYIMQTTGLPLKIYLVEMDGNRGYKKIEEV